MNCPYCNHENTKVIDSRDTNEGKAIRRRRSCEKCQSRFSTYEEVEIIRKMVIKRDGRKQEYDRSKIKSGLERALEKRPVSQDKIEKIIGDIEYFIQSKEDKEVTTREIGKMILEKLKKIDEVAYIRFLSVYRSFGSAETFRKEVDKIKKIE